MMERADDKRESMSRKRKEGKETFSFFFLFSQNENPYGTWMFLKWRGKKKYRDQSTVDGISAIRLKGIEMNIGSHDESSSLN